MDKTMIEMEGITKVYSMGRTEVKALDGIDLAIRPGEYVAVVGASGSGKSTLLSLMGCLDTPTQGRYKLDDFEISELDDNRLSEIRNSKIGFVFQTFNLLSRLTAIKNIELPLLYQSEVRASDRHTKALEALKTVGLEERAQHRPNELSGGECQRVAIARALVINPSIILADEPTGNLDSKSGEEIVSFFGKLNRELQVTLIVVTHNPGVAKHAQRVISMADGRINN